MERSSNFTEAKKVIEDEMSKPTCTPVHKCRLIAMMEALLIIDNIRDRLRAGGLIDEANILDSDKHRACVEGIGRGIAAAMVYNIMTDTPVDCEHRPPCAWLDQAELVASTLGSSTYEYFRQVFLRTPDTDITAPAAGNA